MMRQISIKYLCFGTVAILLAISCKNSGNNTAETFTLSTTISPAGAGSVSPQGGEFDENEQLQLSADANSGWIFKEWNGDVSSSSNPATVTITQNMSVNALFEQLTYPLTVEIEGEGEVSEQIVNAKTDYAEGTMVELTAEPADEWRFVEWTGDLEGSESPTTITMDGSKTINANFEFGFNEDFEDGEAQNWIFSDNRFSVDDGKLKFSTEDGPTLASAFYKQVFSNYKVEVKRARISSQETKNNSLAIFIHSKIDPENKSLIDGYLVDITQGGYASAFLIKDQTYTEIYPWVKFSEINDELGEYNVVTVNAVGSVFEIFLNGKHIITLTDDSLTEGYVGIGLFAGEAGDSRVFWEYVKVSPADPLQTDTNEIQDALKNPSNLVEGNSEGHTSER